MKSRKIMSIILVAIMVVFALPQYATEAKAAMTNYQRAIAEYGSVVNVADYGIDTNGKKEAGAQISKLVRTLVKARTDITQPIVLYMPSGKYLVNQPIKLYYENLHLVAESDTKVSASKTVKNFIEVNNVNNVSVLGGYWDGKYKAKYIMKLNNATNVSASEIVFTKAKERGFYAIKSTAELNLIRSFKNKLYGVSANQNATITIKNSRIYQNNKHGIAISKAVLHMENGNNKVYKNGFSGVSATGKGSKVYISNNQFNYNGTKKDSRGHGVAVSDGGYGEITNNVIKKNQQCGIALTNKTNTIIKDNIISYNKRHGIGAAVKSSFTAENNNIYSNKWHGIMIRDKGTATLTNNKLNKNSVSGLSVEKATAIATGNTMYKNKSNGIIATAAKVTLYNNTITKNKAFGIFAWKKATVKVVSGNVIKSNSKGDVGTNNAKVKIYSGNTVKKIRKN